MLNTVEQINRAVADSPLEFVLECEREYHREIEAVAEHIKNNKHLKIVMLAGPSGSGKTTTAHILCEDLKQREIHTEIVSLDDFYLTFESLPEINGEKDMESINALDLEEIRGFFGEVLKTGRGILPKYDFHAGKKIKNARNVDITGGGVIIVEGLHALNPAITGILPTENLLKIYISVNRSVSNDSGIILTSRQIRLIRRVLRDEIFRNSTMEQTLMFWTKVTAGEEKNLFCFKDLADLYIATLHPYEVCVYAERFCKLANALPKTAENYEYAANTAKSLEHFKTLPKSIIPNDSLLREFVGGSRYTSY